MPNDRSRLALLAALGLAAAAMLPLSAGGAAESKQHTYARNTLTCLKLFFEDPAAHAEQCAGTPTGGTDSLFDGKSGSGGVDCMPEWNGDGDGVASDPCVKYNTSLLLDVDGLRFYSFAYVGDDHVYYGVNARELLADERYAFAVARTAGGYYAVDYEALGLDVPEEAQMRAAGSRAMQIVAARYAS